MTKTMQTGDFEDPRQSTAWHLRPSRRLFLAGLLGTVMQRCLLAQNQLQGHGKVQPPLTLPDVALTMQDGSASSLRALVAGHATAIQLMFTECTTTCPMEGAIFTKVQKLIPDQLERKIQLLSLSIAPKGEEPGALAMWMGHFQARPGWTAAAPSKAGLPRVQAFFGQGRSVNDPHTTQVQIVNRAGQLVWKTSELPSPEEVAVILQHA